MQSERRKFGKRKRKALIFTVIFATMAFVSIGCTSATIIYVPDNYTTIQQAVNVATTGGIIIVRDETYTENVDVYKSLTIRSENGSASTIVQAANPNDHVFEVTADSVNISGFTVRNGNTGIFLLSSNDSTLTNNTIYNSINGIGLILSNTNNITGNIVYNTSDQGIALNSASGNTITDNNVSSNQGEGIFLMDNSNGNTIIRNIASSNDQGGGILIGLSSNNIITNNIVINNTIGININLDKNFTFREHCENNTVKNNIVSNNSLWGIVIVNSSNNTLANNTANNNKGFEGEEERPPNSGILLINSNHNTIESNDASDNYFGILLDNSSSNEIRNNTANNNTGLGLEEDGPPSCGILLVGSHNTIRNNALQNNTVGILVSSGDPNNPVETINNTLTNNTADSSQIGIALTGVSDSTVADNIATNNRGVWGGEGSPPPSGFLIWDSTNITLTNNTASNNDVNLFVQGSDASQYDHSIDGTNKVEGLGVYYKFSEKDIVLDNETTKHITCANCTNVTIKNNNVSNGDPFVLAFTNDSRVDNNTASNNFMGIWLLASSNNTLTDNTASFNNNTGIALGHSNSSLIVNNNVSYSGYQGISVESSQYCEVYGNTVSFSGDRGIVFDGGGNNTAYNNIVYNNSAYGGIAAIHSDNNTIYNNTAYFNCWGIATNGGSNNLIYDNMIYENDLGVYLDWPSTGNVVLNNNISSNGDGIQTNHNSTGNIITGNWLFSNEGAGIHIRTNNNTITSNNASNNAKSGIYIEDSTNNTLTNNTANSNSESGIHLDESHNNRIFHNNLIKNGLNARDNTGTNSWDNGYPSGGNYWSDYKDKYPYAKEIDESGIWDTPYAIQGDADAKDNYPLMNPYYEKYIFDTDKGTYPSIMGTHTGTITPSCNINVSKLYTYACVGTGGHTESIELYDENDTLIANGSWNGYIGDYHNITIHNLTGEAPYVTLLKNHEYRYVIKTGSYPQIIHEPSKDVTGGTITCTNFTDANGVVHYDWIPAIRLYDLQN